MRRIVILLGVSALVASATDPAAYGQVWAYFNSDLWNACNSFPWIPHDSDPLDSNSMVPYFENPSTGPFVTEDGLVFLKKSSGAWSNGSQYELFDPSVAGWLMRMTVSAETTTGGWTTITDDQYNSGGYAGQFVVNGSAGATDGAPNLPSNVAITGSDDLPHLTEPDDYGYAYNQVTMKVQAWIDPAQEAGGASPYSTYAQAVAASHPGSGVFVAQATVQVDVEDITTMPLDFANSLGMYMPALVLQELPPLPGDANGDGTVDINDLTIVLAHYGQTGMTWSQGEFTGDGTVDINDLTIVLANYNKTAGSSGSLAAVPEPSSLACLAAGVVGVLAWIGRKSKWHG